MNKLIVGMLAVAGLAGAANAQSTTSLGNGWSSSTDAAGNEVQLLLLVDGVPAPAGAGAPDFSSILAGVAQYNASASAAATGDVRKVGITLLARVKRATGGNFGVSGFQSTAAPVGGSATPSSFSHNDSFSNGWTGGLQRGAVTAAENIGTGKFGAIGFYRAAAFYNLPAGQADAAGSSGSGNNAWNSPTGNPAAGEGGFPGNPLAGATAAAYNPASLTSGRILSGFINQDANDRTQIRGFSASITTLSSDANLFLASQAAPGAGQFSGWSALERVWFVPQPNPTGADPVRQVTVSVFGRVSVATANSANVSTSVALTNAQGTAATTFGESASVSFFVPTPGAAALLGLGGLAAFRRRR